MAQKTALHHLKQLTDSFPSETLDSFESVLRALGHHNELDDATIQNLDPLSEEALIALELSMIFSTYSRQQHQNQRPDIQTAYQQGINERFKYYALCLKKVDPKNTDDIYHLRSGVERLSIIADSTGYESYRTKATALTAEEREILFATP